MKSGQKKELHPAIQLLIGIIIIWIFIAIGYRTGPGIKARYNKTTGQHHIACPAVENDMPERQE